MKEQYAQILARHVAGILTNSTDFASTKVEVCDLLTSPDTCDLAVSIAIAGGSEIHDDIKGQVIIASQMQEGTRLLLLTLVHHFGFDENLLSDLDGPANVLSEFLNIIIGITSEGWTEHDFNLTFSTPQDVSTQALPQTIVPGTAFSIKVYVDDILMGVLLVYVH